MNNRVLLNYLPPPLREVREFKAIFEGKQGDYEELWREIRNIPQERSIQTSSEIGISHWEKILGVVAPSNDTLEDRRFRVQTRLQDDSKMTFAILCTKLDALCGAGAYEFDYRPDEYYLGVRVALKSRYAASAVLETLERNTPANFLLFVDLLYITYDMLGNLTYEQATTYTYRQLREDATLLAQIGE